MQESTFIIFAVAAVTEFLRRLQLRDYFAVLTIIASAVIGLLAGVFHAPSVPDAWTGLVAGLSASGLVTVASRVSTTGSYSLRKQP